MYDSETVIKNEIVVDDIVSEFVYVDAEWDTALTDPWISTCLHTATETILFFRDDIPNDTRQRIDGEANECNATVHYINRTDDTDMVSLCRIDSHTPIVMFYSPKDIEYSIGWTKEKHAIDSCTMRQKNNILGKVGNHPIVDLCGWSGKKSLVSFAQALGVGMPDKNVMDEYKMNMWKGLIDKPEEFVKYTIGDTVALQNIHTAFCELFTTVQRNCLNMKEKDMWTLETIPSTAGSLVANTFERWLYSSVGEWETALRFCVCKLGLLDPDDKRYKLWKWSFTKALNMFKSKESIDGAHANGCQTLRNMLEARYKFTALDGSSIKWFASRPDIETTVFNALVQGGRCNNENPYEYSIDDGMDIDIAGCYGSALCAFTFPIGLPTVWCYAPDEKRITLGKWMERYRSDVVDGLWCVTVSGDLSFEQDIVYSKLAKARDIKRIQGNDDAKINVPFALLRKEIRNGIITSDVLNTLRAVSTSQEWSEIRNLEVVTACAYLKSDRCKDVGEWCEEVLQSSGRFRMVDGMPVDGRTKAWFGVPIDSYLSGLLNKRKECKRLKGDKTLSDDERKQYAGLDEILKLLVNTMYGTFASQYFRIGNTVLANTITARARVGVWMVAKALGLRQTITDGGIYSPSTVNAYHRFKPGLDVFSRPWEWKDNKCRMVHALPDGKPDEVATEHIRQFWKPYGLVLPFGVEHKLDNQFKRAAYWGKADYCLLTECGKKYSIRGKEKKPKGGERLHPAFALLDNVILNDNTFPDDMAYRKGGILKIGKYKAIQCSEGYQGKKHFRPGDNIPTEERMARFNNTHFPCQTETEFMRRKNRKSIDHGKMVEWFERYRKVGIQTVHSHMQNDSLR